MKAHHLKIIILSLLLAGCANRATQPAIPDIAEKEVVENIKPDTVYVRDTVYVPKAMMTDECLEYKLMVLNVRHYIQITERNKNNQRFFYGWVKRAVEEQK